jgi:uncharacterized membrane protein
MNRRRALLALAAAVGLLAVAPAATPAAPAAQPSLVTCKRATIGGQHKCIARGQFCAVRYASQYRRYGLSCTYRDANGRYHLH